MKKHFLLLIFSCFRIIAFAQTNNIKYENVEKGIKACWQYMYSKDTLKGEILDYLPNNVLCGEIPTASTAFIKLSTGDTIRLIQFCDAGERKYKKLQKVKIISTRFTSIETTYMPVSRGEDECNIQKTFYGYILREK